MFGLNPLQKNFIQRLSLVKVLIGVFFTLSTFTHAQVQSEISIAAAANLHNVLNQLINQYSKSTGQNIRVVYGSSGQLYQQITQGAKFDIFLSANEDFVDRLVSQNLSLQPGVVYARGRLALLVSSNSVSKIKPQWPEIKKAVLDGRLSKFAIANPALAPYGLAAKQVLEKLGVMGLVQPLLVYGGDVGQTMLFVQSEAAQVGLVPLSMVKTSSNISENSYLIIDENLHQPILQKMVILKNANSQALGFYQFLQNALTRNTWRQFGYE
jgi:molybdate transport system substrate-binding protein